MIIPEFTFDAEANGFLSEPFTVDQIATVHIELSERAPVVILKKEDDGEYANYGQTPKQSDAYRLNLTAKNEMTVILATPVEVKKCWIAN
jgi:hypothetical protein